MANEDIRLPLRLRLRLIYIVGLTSAIAACFSMAAQADDKAIITCQQFHDAETFMAKASDDDAVADYVKAEADYRAAARLFFECALQSKVETARNEMTLRYASALYHASAYDQHPTALLEKVISVSQTIHTTAATNLVNLAKAQLRKQTVAVHAAAATTSPSPPQTAPTSNAMCAQDMQGFSDALDSWRGAANRYIKSTDDTTSAQPSSARPGMAWLSAAIYAGYEVKAIRSAIDAEEPKIATAEQQIESDGLTQLEQYTSTIQLDVHTFDDYALTYSQNRYQYLETLNSGGYPSSPDPTAGSRAHDAKLQIEADETKLRVANPCGLAGNQGGS